MAFFRRADAGVAKPAPATTKKDAAGRDRAPAYVGGAIAAVVSLLALATVFDGLDRRWSDQLFRWRGPEAADPRIVVVTIDDDSIKKIGQYPWPRSVYGKLLKRLYAAGVKVVALDVLFLDPSYAAEDKALIEATVAAGKRVVHSADHDPNDSLRVILRKPFQALAKVSKSIGAVDQRKIDPDGSVRRTLLLNPHEIQTDDQWKPGVPVPSLGLRALSVLEGKPPESYLAGRDNEVILNVRGQSFVLQGTDPATGEDVWGIKHEIPRLAAGRVLEGSLLEPELKLLKGTVVLVGSTAVGAFDHYPSPFTDSQAGVEVHATVIDNLLNDRFLEPVPSYVTVLLCFLFAALSAGTLSFGPMVGAVVTALAFLGWAAFSYYLFLSLRVIEFAAPSLSLIGTFAVLLVRKALSEQQEKRFIKQTFGQFVAPEVVDKLVKDPTQLKLGGDKREMTAFFLDIAHFTDISEKMTAEELIAFLNKYLSALSKVVQDRKGVVDKYIGDCVMAFWNAPLDDPDHRANACLTAVECQAVVKELNKSWDYKRYPEAPAIRIGVNSGSMVVGLTGSERKLAYTVIGDEVNLASRLEGANKFFGSKIMVSESCYEGARAAAEARVLGKVRVIGKQIPIKVFELLAPKGQLPPEWKEALPLYEKAVELFQAEKFAEAKDAFAGVIKLIPDDKPAKLYLNACEDYIAIPPNTDDWRVFKLTAK